MFTLDPCIYPRETVDVEPIPTASADMTIRVGTVGTTPNANIT